VVGPSAVAAAAAAAAIGVVVGGALASSTSQLAPEIGPYSHRIITMDTS